MKTKIVTVCIVSFFWASCVSVPRESVTLSRVLDRDLIALQNSHRQLATMYFGKIKDDINVFVDEVYSPFVIHFVLNAEMERHNAGEASLFRSIENAARMEGIAVSEDALNTMLDFQKAANAQIQAMRNELLGPVEEQEMLVTEEIIKSYGQVINANHTLTAYLESVHKVKEGQQEALSLVGLQNADSLITGRLLKVAELVHSAVEKGKNIDVKSEEALFEIEEISKQIKNIIH